MTSRVAKVNGHVGPKTYHLDVAPPSVNGNRQAEPTSYEVQYPEYRRDISNGYCPSRQFQNPSTPNTSKPVDSTSNSNPNIAPDLFASLTVLRRIEAILLKADSTITAILAPFRLLGSLYFMVTGMAAFVWRTFFRIKDLFFSWLIYIIPRLRSSSYKLSNGVVISKALHYLSLPLSIPRLQLLDLMPREISVSAFLTWFYAFPSTSLPAPESPPVRVLLFPETGTSPQLIHLRLLPIVTSSRKNIFATSKHLQMSQLPDMRSFWGQQGWDDHRVAVTVYDGAALGDGISNGVSGLYCVIWSGYRDGALRMNGFFKGSVRGDVCVVKVEDRERSEWIDVEERLLTDGLWKGLLRGLPEL